MPARRTYPELYGCMSVDVSAAVVPRGWLRWTITPEEPDTPGVVLVLHPFDLVILGRMSVAALKAAAES